MMKTRNEFQIEIGNSTVSVFMGEKGVFVTFSGEQVHTELQFSPFQWEQFRDDIRNIYTIEEVKNMESVLGGQR